MPRRIRQRGWAGRSSRGRALRLPAEWKLSCDGAPEKQLLREAFEGWLPHDLLWRDKSQFGELYRPAGVTHQGTVIIVHGEVRPALQRAADAVLSTSQMVKYVEAHPEKQKFAILTECGLVVRLGEWVLHRACADAMTWPSDILLSFNISPVQLREILYTERGLAPAKKTKTGFCPR